MFLHALVDRFLDLRLGHDSMTTFYEVTTQARPQKTKSKADLPSGVARPTAPKPPKEYGKYLAQVRERLGLSRAQVAELGGFDYNTVMRLEQGDESRSVKGANSVRDALIKAGAKDVAPVPVGEDVDWQQPSVRREGREDPTEENIRRNLIRARETLDIDQFAAAHATRIPYEELRAYELGEKSPSTAVLGKFAQAYGCTAGSFLEETAPAVDRARASQYWYGGPATEDMTEDERTAVEKIFASVTARTRAAKAKKPSVKRK